MGAQYLRDADCRRAGVHRGWATPTGSNEPLYGRTDTKSPMVYSSMVHVAGGEGGSIRHDDDGRPALRAADGYAGGRPRGR